MTADNPSSVKCRWCGAPIHQHEVQGRDHAIWAHDNLGPDDMRFWCWDGDGQSVLVSP
jgi:hypothetical protein